MSFNRSKSRMSLIGTPNRNKTAYELELMKKASEITGKAHTALMRAIGSGDVQDENAAEAVFTSVCRRMG